MNEELITRYALGELEGPEREAFERELAASDTLQAELKATLSFCNQLEQLATDMKDTLTPEQRATVRDTALANRKIARRNIAFRRVVLAVGLTAAAACVLLVPTFTASLTRSTRQDVSMLADDKKQPEFNGASSPAATPTQMIAAAKPAGEVAGLDRSATAASSEVLPANEPQSQLVAAASAKDGTKASEWARRMNDELKQQASKSVALNAPVLPVSTTASTATLAGKAGEELSGRLAESGTGLRQESFGYADKAGSADIRMRGGLFKSDTDSSVAAPPDDFNTETYDSVESNRFLDVKGNPLSTFSIDVDTASYANIRRFLTAGSLPPAGAVRIEEMINYFPYNYATPKNGDPFAVNLEAATCPWNAAHLLVRIALKGRELEASARPPSNLVFLIDVSGSMEPENKLPLLKRSLRALVENLGPKDRVAIAVYAGASGLALPSTSDKRTILDALDRLDAGGSTNGAEGIRLAYQTARENLLTEGNNRVILCTDGDFNVGVTNQSELVEIIEKERASGVFLSVLGFGDGNLKDSTMEKLADKGNGNYAYIDTFSEGRKVLVNQMGGTLFTIAKDVKIQVEFNPAQVAAYRLIGYENRLLAKEDFNDDKKDAGEIGAGHTVTAFYEVVPAGQPIPQPRGVDPLKYQAAAPMTEERPASADLLTVKLRFKQPQGDTSRLIEFPFSAPSEATFAKASDDFRFATAVAAFGLNLRGSADAMLPVTEIQQIARQALGTDPGSHRAEFLTLVEKAAALGKTN